MRGAHVIENLPEITHHVLNIAGLSPEFAAGIRMSREPGPTAFFSDIEQLNQLQEHYRVYRIWGNPASAAQRALCASVGALVRIDEDSPTLEGNNRRRVGNAVSSMAHLAIKTTTAMYYDRGIWRDEQERKRHVAHHHKDYSALQPFMGWTSGRLIRQTTKT